MKYYIRILRRELIYPNPQNNITVFLMTNWACKLYNDNPPNW